MKDPIERQDAIDALNVCMTIGRGNGKSVALKIANDYADIVKKRIEALPSAQPEVDCQKCVFCGFAGFKQFQTAQSDVSDTNVGDMISRRAAIDARRYTFGNDEFSLEAAYHDCKMVFDGITDDDSFQEADTGLILYYANEIIYALQEALVKDTNVPTNDCISRQAAIDEITEYGSGNTIYMSVAELKRRIEHLPSAQPDRSLLFRIGEICVDESKGFISAGRAVEKIRELLREAERRTDDQQRNIL